MADILSFPEHAPRLRLVTGNTQADFEMRHLTEAADCAGAAVSNITNAVMRIAAGARLEQAESVLSGDTLEEVLNAALSLISLRGSNADRDLRRQIIDWLALNGSETD